MLAVLGADVVKVEPPDGDAFSDLVGLASVRGPRWPPTGVHAGRAEGALIEPSPWEG